LRIAANISSNRNKLAGKNGDLSLRGFFKEIMARIEKCAMTSIFHLQNVSIVLFNEDHGKSRASQFGSQTKRRRE